MKIKDIDLVNVSRFRAEHMGMAMLFVILFHVGLPRWSDFYGLRRMGNLGVDMFLFLSGVGLWFSWAKRSVDGSFFKDWVSFYMRRLKRIYPVWLIIACLYYIPRFDGVHWIDLFGDILINWDFWLHDELTFGIFLLQ